MAARPQNIGIKAIEVYFPTQVRSSFSQIPSACNWGLAPFLFQLKTNPYILVYSVSTRLTSRSTMASVPESTPLVSAKPR